MLFYFLSLVPYPYQVLFYCSFIRAEHAPLSDRGSRLDNPTQPLP